MALMYLIWICAVVLIRYLSGFYPHQMKLDEEGETRRRGCPQFIRCLSNRGSIPNFAQEKKRCQANIVKYAERYLLEVY